MTQVQSQRLPGETHLYGCPFGMPCIRAGEVTKRSHLFDIPMTSLIRAATTLSYAVHPTRITDAKRSSYEQPGRDDQPAGKSPVVLKERRHRSRYSGRRRCA